MRTTKKQSIFGSVCLMAIVTALGCADHTVDSSPDQTAQTQQEAMAQESEESNQPDARIPAIEIQSDAHTPSRAERIAELRDQLASLDEMDDTDLESNPHRERLQDPNAIQDAIRQLEQGEDICTRCLMACGAP